MVLEFFSRDVEELIAKGKYARAARLLSEALDGGGRDPRTRLRLADVLILDNRAIEALPILFDLSDDYAAEGQAAKAIALIKKVQRLSPGHPDAEERLAALIKSGPRPRAAADRPDAGYVPYGRTFTADYFVEAPPVPPAGSNAHIETLRSSTWVPSTREEAEEADAALPPIPPPAAETSDDGEPAIEVVPEPESPLTVSPLFSGFSEDELLAVIRGFQLKTFEPGDIVIIEGDAGDSLFVVTTGTVKAFVRNPAGGEPLLVRRMGEGDFFGEISILSGKPRTATVTAAAPCELLELDRAALERITQRHPNVRQVLEDFYISRASTQEEAMRRSLEAKGSSKTKA
jgi:hypothetical protein